MSNDRGELEHRLDELKAETTPLKHECSWTHSIPCSVCDKQAIAELTLAAPVYEYVAVAKELISAQKLEHRERCSKVNATVHSAFCQAWSDALDPLQKALET